MDQGITFAVYQQPFYIHFLLAHSDRTKSAVLIGFFLRVLRICSEEYLESECEYIVSALKKKKNKSVNLKDFK